MKVCYALARSEWKIPAQRNWRAVDQNIFLHCHINYDKSQSWMYQRQFYVCGTEMIFVVKRYFENVDNSSVSIRVYKMRASTCLCICVCLCVVLTEHFWYVNRVMFSKRHIRQKAKSVRQRTPLILCCLYGGVKSVQVPGFGNGFCLLCTQSSMHKAEFMKR